MKSVLTAILTIALVSVLVGAGTFAYYADTEVSSGNTFTAGTMDLKINDEDPDAWDDGAIATWVLSDMKPGDSKTGSVIITKEGSLDADHLEITCDYSVDDELPQSEADTDWFTDLHPDLFAKNMTIVSALYDNGDVYDLITGIQWDFVGSGGFEGYIVQHDYWKITDGDGDGRVTIYDLKYTGPDDLPAPNNHDYTFRMNVKFDESAGNDFQGDTLNLDVIFTLNQHSSQ